MTTGRINQVTFPWKTHARQIFEPYRGLSEQGHSSGKIYHAIVFSLLILMQATDTAYLRPRSISPRVPNQGAHAHCEEVITNILTQHILQEEVTGYQSSASISQSALLKCKCSPLIGCASWLGTISIVELKTWRLEYFDEAAILKLNDE
jgi:hypothetical protein